MAKMSTPLKEMEWQSIRKGTVVTVEIGTLFVCSF